MKCVPCTVANVEEAKSPEGFEGAYSPRYGTIVDKKGHNIDPKGDKNNDIDYTP